MRMPSVMLTLIQVHALREAAQYDGWAFTCPATTQRLALEGMFRREQHPTRGTRFRLTEHGRRIMHEYDPPSTTTGV